METVNCYPVGIQTFEEIRERKYLYIDKTQYIVEFLRKQMKYVFLSRPRRFGKSLFASTLHAYYAGKKELFEGLVIADYEKEWVKHPVLHFDMSGAKHVEKEQLTSYLDFILTPYEKLYGGIENKDANLRLINLVHRAYEQTGRKVVVILDEYDAPLLDVIHEEEDMGALRRIMQNFYSPLKSLDPYLEFVFITGITKFSQLSIFSELNNLYNISMLDDFSAICGISKGELTTQMHPDIEMLGKKYDLSYEEMLEKLADRYDGYHFSEHSEDIFNPFSLMSCMLGQQLGSYWFGSGTPTFLLNVMQKFDTDLTELENKTMMLSSFDRSPEEMTEAVPLLYQSGYLTIKTYEPEFEEYTLGIPNKEVKDGLIESLMPRYVNPKHSDNADFVLGFCKAVKRGRIEEALERMKAYLATIPYNLENRTEKHFQTIFYLMFSFVNTRIQTEVRSAIGRADVVMHTPDAVYVVELKVDGTVEEALRQIDGKGYMLPYAANGKRLIKIGINFDSTTRTLSNWKIVEEI